ARERDRAAIQRRVRSYAGGRNLLLRGLWRPTVQLEDEIRVGYRLAQLLRAGQPGSGRAALGQQPLHAPYRGPLPQLWVAPWQRLQRRSGADGRALLHQFRGARAEARSVSPTCPPPHGEGIIW